jgi:hypothetical protein
MANNKIIDVIISHKEKLVYIILPKLVMSETSAIPLSQVLLFAYNIVILSSLFSLVFINII